jgi:hypothetical protein
MSNVTKFALSAAIILSTAFSALAASKPGATREQAASSGTGVASYDRYGGIAPDRRPYRTSEPNGFGVKRPLCFARSRTPPRRCELKPRPFGVEPRRKHAAEFFP